MMAKKLQLARTEGVHLFNTTGRVMPGHQKTEVTPETQGNRVKEFTRL
jgi:hypothetical protein